MVEMGVKEPNASAEAIPECSEAACGHGTKVELLFPLLTPVSSDEWALLVSRARFGAHRPQPCSELSVGMGVTAEFTVVFSVLLAQVRLPSLQTFQLSCLFLS